MAELDRVGDEVEQDLLQLQHIDAQRRQVVGDIDIEADIEGMRALAHELRARASYNPN